MSIKWEEPEDYYEHLEKNRLKASELIFGKQRVPEEGAQWPEGYNVVIYNDDITPLQLVYETIKKLGYRHKIIVQLLENADTQGFALVYNSSDDFPLYMADEKEYDMLKRGALNRCLEISNEFSSVGIQNEIVQGTKKITKENYLK